MNDDDDNKAPKEVEEPKDKNNREVFLNDRSARRNARKKSKLTENTLEMQSRYEDEGYKNIAEIAFLMANESYEDLLEIAASDGIKSSSYNFAFNRLNNAVKTALPYFAMQLKPEMLSDDEQKKMEDVETALRNMLNKKQ